MPIGMPGVGSGLDLGTVIDQLMAIQRRPLERVQAQQQDLESQISAYGRISSSVSSFRASLSALRFPTAFNVADVTSSSETVATATALTGAVESSYGLVVTDLAQAHKMASARYADSATAVGTGTFSLTVDGTTLDITVDGTNNTLAGLRDAINGAAGNPGISASLINESGGTRLILQSDETGAANGITIAFSGDGSGDADNVGLSKLFYIDAGDAAAAEEVLAAQDAAGTVDGFAFTSASNAVTGVVDNLTFNLKAAGSTTLTVSRDKDAIKATIQNFVDKYNTLLEDIGTEREDRLRTDTSLRILEGGMLDVFNSPAGGTFGYLAEIGIERDRFGVMSINSTALDNALDNNLNDVVDLFTDETSGVAVRLYDYTTALIDADGLIGSRQEGLTTRKGYLQLDELRLQDLLEATETRLVRQFAQLDQLVASFKGISDYLAGQLSSNN